MPLFPPKPRTNFYLHLGNYLDQWAPKAAMIAEHPTDPVYLGGLNHFVATYERTAIAALDLGFGDAEAQRWFAEEAGCATARSRVRKDTGAFDAWTIFGALAIAGDREATKRYAAAHAESNDARSGGKRGRCSSPQAWRTVEAILAYWNKGDASAEVARMRADGDQKFKFPGGPEAYASWCDLAEACVLAEKPTPYEALKQAAIANQKFYKSAYEDFVYEEFLAVRLLAFAAIARDRGWKVEGADPHPSVPLSLLRLPARTVIEREPTAWPRPEGELLAAIERARAETKA